MKPIFQSTTTTEAFSAVQFARRGWDISFHDGANQPKYYLVAADGDRMMKLSVKGSKDGGCDLTQPHCESHLAEAVEGFSDCGVWGIR